jgi:hypothetical protein
MSINYQEQVSFQTDLDLSCLLVPLVKLISINQFVSV